MSFQFNFESPENETENNTNCQDTDSVREDASLHEEAAGKGENEPESLPVCEVTEFYSGNITCKFDIKSMKFGECCLKVVDTSTLEQKLIDDRELSPLIEESSQLQKAISSHSDLVAGVYEGGLKIWECGVDLAQFLASHPIGKDVDIKGKRVLELGCGAGLPGLYCCRCGADSVHFQDYNKEVLKLLTHTNLINCTSEAEQESLNCRFFGGDWSSFSSLASTEGLKYDLILTAETIYNTDSYSKLHNVFRTALAEDGVIFVAAKTYYFGVGGSVDAFIEYVGSQNCFSVDVVHTISKGVPRKILCMRRLT